MNNSGSNNRTRFERQRKNLMISSVFMMIYLWIGLKVETINFFGNQVKIQNATNVEAVLWLIFFYFLFRYLQYFFVVENKEFYMQLNVFIDDYLKQGMAKKQKKEAIAEIKTENPKATDFLYTINDFSVYDRNPSYWNVKLKSSIAYSYGTGSRSQGLGDLGKLVYKRELLIPKLRSLIKVFFVTPHFTEYILPYVLASFALASKIITILA